MSERRTKSDLQPRTAVARKRALALYGAIEADIAEAIDARPKTRADCVDGPRPCPFAGCRYHLYLDASEATGTIKLNHPDLEVHELVETCALDVADRGGLKLEEVGALMSITRERARQIEAEAGAKVAARLAHFVEGDRRKLRVARPDIEDEPEDLEEAVS